MFSFSHGSKDNHRVQNFRSKELSVFALFTVGQVDAGRLVQMVERLDPKYKGAVDIKAFGAAFCGEHVDAFHFLFEKFFRLLVPKPKKTAEVKPKDDTVSEMSSIKESHTDARDPLQVDSIQHSFSYHHFLSFLLFFMSVSHFDLVLFLYWLCYPAHDVLPDHKNMEELINELWPPSTKLKSRAQNLLLTLETADLMSNNMHMMDVKGSGAWSKPLQGLRRVIIQQNKLGKRFWKRVGVAVHQACLNVKDCYNELKDPYRLSKWGRQNFALTGERKAARKDMRVVVRLVMKYFNMPMDKDDLVKDPRSQQLMDLAIDGRSSIAGQDGSIVEDTERAESRIDKAIRFGAMPFYVLSITAAVTCRLF
ncbi:hypothetical protein B484DRAFT_400276 [Ochromonadaceae sp. CCMP2298]|nr:hypothetical protein B484DRAFT_400276 [Ochromonadaceae sp. CCMP2298]